MKCFKHCPCSVHNKIFCRVGNRRLKQSIKPFQPSGGDSVAEVERSCNTQVVTCLQSQVYTIMDPRLGELVLHLSLVFGCNEIQIQRSYRMKLTNKTHGLITFSILPQNFTHQDFNII